MLVVYDPSLGFTTGGGWFIWPDGSGDKTNFGYTMKYNKKATDQDQPGQMGSWGIASRGHPGPTSGFG